MASLAIPTRSFACSVAALLRREGRASRPAPLEPDPQAEDDARVRRAFIVEMLDRNPDAFCSDYDMRTLMQHYPGNF